MQADDEAYFDRLVNEAFARLSEAMLTAEGDMDAAFERISLPHPFSNMTAGEWAHCVSLWRKSGAPLIAGLDPRDCPACGGRAGARVLTSYDGYEYSECVDCRCWFVPKVVDAALFEKYFALEPGARRYGDYTEAQHVVAAAEDSDRARFSAYYADLRDVMGAPASKSLTALDIGCGVGNSLDAAAALGFLADGVEVNENARRIACSAGRRVFAPNDSAACAAYDVVTFWESLEHIADPLAALKGAGVRLAPGGVLALTVPNLASPALRDMRGDSMHIHGGPAWPGHINLFTADTVRLLLDRAGMQMIYATGQYSANLFEIMAHRLGRWAGARDHLRNKEPAVELPSKLTRLLRAVSPFAAAAEEIHALGPILRVLAVRKGDPIPSGLDRFKEKRLARVVGSLRAAYGEVGPISKARGARLTFDGVFADRQFITNGPVALFSGAAASPFAYLWKSAPIEIAAGDHVRLRGKLYRGGFGFGLLKGDAWAAQTAISEDGAFDLEVAAEASGAYDVVIASIGEEEIDADFDAIEVA